jgi:hypothetical protein
MLNRRRTSKTVYAFHGTSKEWAVQIKRHGFRASTNDYDWLGDGIYFGQDAPRRAYEWAEKHHRDSAAVIGARLTLSSSCMDLLDIDWWEQLERAYALLVAEAARTKTPVRPHDHRRHFHRSVAQ